MKKRAAVSDFSPAKPIVLVSGSIVTHKPQTKPSRQDRTFGSPRVSHTQAQKHTTSNIFVKDRKGKNTNTRRVNVFFSQLTLGFIFFHVDSSFQKYPEDELLLVYDKTFAYGQCFYLVLTPEAKEKLLKVRSSLNEN